MHIDKKIYHYYHAFADGNDSLVVIQEHLSNLISSKLSKYLEKFYVCIVGSDENRKKIKDLLFSFPGEIRVEILVEDSKGYEQITLEKMLENSKNQEGYYFYAHSKSSSNNRQSNKCWMHTMEIYNVLEWADVLPLLNSVDAVGCFWMTYNKYPKHVHWSHTNNDTNSFFAGNYWWTTSDIIKQLPKPDTANRYMAEQWIGNKPDLKVHDLRAGLPKPKNFNCGKSGFDCVCKRGIALKKARNIIFYTSTLIVIYLIIRKIFN